LRNYLIVSTILSSLASSLVYPSLTTAADEPVAAPRSPSALANAALQQASPKGWSTREADFVIPQFRFRSGETLANLRIHYTTLGQPHRDTSGQIDNAVMALHGTGGSGHDFLLPQFADELYGPGQPLDITRYWIILVDNIGHGKSSKPSDGQRMGFPRYDYDDMIEAQYRLLRDHLGIAKMRLVMGISMGCMNTFVWGETHPDYVRALMPLACEPIEIGGFNRMWRQLLVDAIKGDPAWADGNYKAEPTQGMRTAASLLFNALAAPLNFQTNFPQSDKAAAYAEESVSHLIAALDANNLIYQVDASRTYDPWPRLEAITTPLMWLNSADDLINPHGLDVPRRAVARMPNSRFRLIPETAVTHGHDTYTWAVYWKDDLRDLLAKTEAPAS
jgi:homoserine O-acetyltransferase/O-succinyltransferase